MRASPLSSSATRLITPLLALLLTAFGLTAAGPAPALGSQVAARASTGSHTWTVRVGAQTSDGAIQTMNYGPRKIWIDKGDTIRWVAKSKEIHTVSFINAKHPDSGYSPAVAYMNTRTPQRSIHHPGQFRNSGILDLTSDGPGAQYRSYSLRFTGVGTYRYICYVHGGRMMHGTVVVRRAGMPYPHTQAWYKLRSAAADNRLIDHGLNLWDSALGSATAHHIYVGASDGRAMVMRYIGGNVTIRAGESITFDMGKNMIPVPHTVTFGPAPAGLAPVGNPAAWNGTGTLSSGILLPPGFGPPGGSTYTVTFTTPGVYGYYCLLHAGMGMAATITVTP